MNPSPPASTPHPARRWLLSLLVTRPSRRLLHTTLITTLALQLSTPAFAEMQGNARELQPGTYSVLRIPYSESENTQYAIRNTSSLQNPKSKTPNPYSVPAVQ